MLMGKESNLRRIESVDLFYLSMPHITTEGDGSQDALLVRVTSGGLVGWGECEASPLVSIAAFVCPMSHGACRPVGASVLGHRLEDPADIENIAAQIELHSMDLLQAPHTWSGVEMALWDLLGKALSEPVWRLLGYAQAHRKLPYASQLFGDSPQQTYARALKVRQHGYRAVKFGWGPIGKNLKDDLEHFAAAREGLGSDGMLMVDFGQIFGHDIDAAASRLNGLEQAETVWIEEPFHTYALAEYANLARLSRSVPMAGGEGAHHPAMARNLIDYGGVGFIQVDCGRIGGIGPAKRVADYANSRGVTYVNHTFTSHLALSASLQPYAGLRDHQLCEYPVALKPLARELTSNHLERDDDGFIALPEAPGLGMTVDTEAATRYLVEVEIRVGSQSLAPAGSLQ